ncbi:MAG: amylo-alpha-1,6-glucosidase [Chryseolinea sp.]
MNFDKTVLSDFDAARGMEWIESNGLGGYASSTVSGAHSRKYHGLLVAALNPPVEKTVMLSKLEETIVVDQPDASVPSVRYELSSNQYPGVVHPTGYSYLEKFSRDLFPEFYYNCGGIKLKKTIAAVNGENTTLVLYEVLDAFSSIVLELVPLASARDYHHLSYANDTIGGHYLFDKGIFRTVNYPGGTELFISVPGADFKEGQAWYYNFEYVAERERGLEFKEDLYSQGRFSVRLASGDKLGIIVSTSEPEGRSAWKLFALEKKRREKLAKNYYDNRSLKRLVLAADQFVVRRGKLTTIIAGYHWFADWGRDTMISLTGLCLVTRRFEEAKEIILQFAKYVSEGMLPNRFPDNGEQPEYNTIDASLWFFHAIRNYYLYTRDVALVKSLLPILDSIIISHYHGTRYNIKVDPHDELLSGGADKVQLTWMDAKVGDWVVTPRRGKVVEINALWYNALRSMEYFYDLVQKPKKAKVYEGKAGRVYESFNREFWNENGNYLYDYIDGDYRCADLRPNQLYALSLSYPLLAGYRAKCLLQIITQNLLTPRGPRSLNEGNEQYQPHYVGDIWKRDGSYHQGTVWSFLLGPYVDALFYVDEEAARDPAIRLIKEFLNHLDEAGIGTISEIFDGAYPHAPRGCISQAWGVGEVLRVIVEHSLDISESNN